MTERFKSPFEPLRAKSILVKLGIMSLKCREKSLMSRCITALVLSLASTHDRGGTLTQNLTMQVADAFFLPSFLPCCSARASIAHSLTSRRRSLAGVKQGLPPVVVLGAHSGCTLGFVDIKTKVLFQYIYAPYS